MKWSETFTFEVPDDWPMVSSLEDLPKDCLAEIKPFDPATESSDVDDLHYESVEEVDEQ